MTMSARTRPWTRAEYERLIEIGVFRADEPVELLGGQLIVSEPQGSAHYTAVLLAEEALRAALGAGWLVRTQGRSRWTMSRSPSRTSPRSQDAPGTTAARIPYGPLSWSRSRRRAWRTTVRTRAASTPSIESSKSTGSRSGCGGAGRLALRLEAGVRSTVVRHAPGRGGRAHCRERSPAVARGSPF